MEESSRPEGEPKPLAPSRTKKPDMAIYVPKRQQSESQTKSRENPQSVSDKKPKGRPRYTDKARRYNTKNKKDKNGGDKKETRGEGCTNSEDKPSVKEGGEEKDETVEKEEDCTEDPGKRVSSEDVNTTTHTTSEVETAETEQNLKEEEEEEKQSDNWDSLFTDDGECLNPHLLQEVEHFI